MSSELSKSILNKIHQQDIKPRPRWVFWIKNALFWIIFAVSAVFGGRAIGVMVRIASESDLPMMMRAHGSIFPPLITLLPLFWIIFFLLFLLFSAYGLHQTKHGYRYSTTRLIGINLLMSLVIGVGSFALEESDLFEEALHQQAPFFQGIEEHLQQAWNHPEEGRLGGVINALPDDHTIDLQAFDHQHWSIIYDVSDTPQPFVLQEGILIRVIGSIQDKSTFQAVEIHPWPRPNRLRKTKENTDPQVRQADPKTP